MIEEQISSGPEDFSLGYANLFLNDVPVPSGATVEVDPVIKQWLRLQHNVINANPYSWGDPTGSWRTCMTIRNVTDNTPVGSATSQAQGGDGGGNPSLNVGVITKSVKFRIKLWANQGHSASPPPSSYW